MKRKRPGENQPKKSILGWWVNITFSCSIISPNDGKKSIILKTMWRVKDAFKLQFSSPSGKNQSKTEK